MQSSARSSRAAWAASRYRVVGPRDGIAETGPSAPPKCAAHFRNAATRLCSACRQWICAECVSVKSIQGVDHEVCACGGLCGPIPALDLGRRPTGGIERVLEALRYPWRGSGRFLLLVTAVVVALLRLPSDAFGGSALAHVSSMTILFAVATLLVFGYVCDYLFDVITSTAHGRDETPDWPDFTDLWSSALEPLFRAGAVGIVGTLPAIALHLLTHSTALVWVGLAAGMTYVPMALLLVASQGGFAGISPHLVLPAIRTVGAPYFVVAAGFLATLAVRAFLVDTVGGIPFVGSLLTTLVGFYLLIAAARMVGTLQRDFLE